MKKILVTYATFAGSTAEVAQTIGEELAAANLHVDVLPLRDVGELAGYDAVVVGGPMILGWHRSSLRFLKRNRKALQRIPLAVFVMAMSLTQTEEQSVSGVPVMIDTELSKAPVSEVRLNFRERYARLSNYLRPIVKAVRPSRPANIGVFGGKLDYSQLKWWALLFVTIVIQARAGDRRNWDAIRAWARGLPAALKL
jgi:menaquinone-dependent protoporphyrinogen oxidase